MHETLHRHKSAMPKQTSEIAVITTKQKIVQISRHFGNRASWRLQIKLPWLWGRGVCADDAIITPPNRQEQKLQIDWLSQLSRPAQSLVRI